MVVGMMYAEEEMRWCFDMLLAERLINNGFIHLQYLESRLTYDGA